MADKLASHGIPDAEEYVVTAAMAAASMVEPGVRVLAVGSEGLRAALVERGAELVDTPTDVDVVAVGITLDFDYAMMTAAMRAVRAGARFIATNDDTTFPDADGLLPGNGALVAAIAACAEQVPEVAGKPHEPIAAFVRERLGDAGIMVGDRPDTDGRFAGAMGYDFALVLTGVVGPADLPVDPSPRFVADDLLSLVQKLT